MRPLYGRGKKGKSLSKKSGGILCEGNRLEAYRFIEQHHNEFGLRWLLRRFNICPNAYYNYRKHRKADHYARREKVLSKMVYRFYLFFGENHEVRYNCTIIDLHARSVVASITDRHITSDLAICTLKKALESQPVLKGELILHSDQGSQFTSKAFVEFCESVHVTQSMSKAGYPYDNAPMEGYFNTLKSELIYLYEYDAEEALYQARIALMRYDARMDCLSTSYRECSAYVKDKAAKGGAKHPLHTRNTPVISK